MVDWGATINCKHTKKANKSEKENLFLGVNFFYFFVFVSIMLLFTINEFHCMHFAKCHYALMSFHSEHAFSTKRIQIVNNI